MKSVCVGVVGAEVGDRLVSPLFAGSLVFFKKRGHVFISFILLL